MYSSSNLMALKLFFHRGNIHQVIRWKLVFWVIFMVKRESRGKMSRFQKYRRLSLKTTQNRLKCNLMSHDTPCMLLSEIGLPCDPCLRNCIPHNLKAHTGVGGGVLWRTNFWKKHAWSMTHQVAFESVFQRFSRTVFDTPETDPFSIVTRVSP